MNNESYKIKLVFNDNEVKTFGIDAVWNEEDVNMSDIPDKYFENILYSYVPHARDAEKLRIVREMTPKGGTIKIYSLKSLTLEEIFNHIDEETEEKGKDLEDESLIKMILYTIFKLSWTFLVNLITIVLAIKLILFVVVSFNYTWVWVLAIILTLIGMAYSIFRSFTK